MKRLVLAVWLLSAVASAQTFQAMRFTRDGAAAVSVVTSVAVNDASATPITGSPCVGGDCAFTLPAVGAPTDATFITQTASSSLSAEQATGALATGLVSNTTTTGVLSIYAGATCTNQALTALSAAGAATCSNITGSFLSGTFAFPGDVTVPSGNCYGAPSLGKMCITSTDGRFLFQTNAGNNTATLSSGNSSSGSAVLLTGSGGVATATGNAGGNGFMSSSGWKQVKVAKTSDFTFGATDGWATCDATSGNVTGTLPAAAAAGQTYTLTKIDTSANTCSVTRAGSNTIDLILTVTLSTLGDHVTVVDNGNATVGHWHITGGNYSVQTCDTQATANGASVAQCSASELLTLSTSGLTTQTTANLLPAGAIIDSVVTRITTAITTTTNWAVGDSTTTSRFSAANATKTLGTVQVGLAHMSGAVTTLAAGPTQAAADKVQITCTGSNPGAGAVRITVFYRLFTAPTS